MVHFSKLGESIRGELNALALVKQERERKSLPVLDLTAVTTGEKSMHFPQDELSMALLHGLEQAQVYHPDPLGQLCARQAIADFYQDHGINFDVNRMILTPGSSLAYLYLFKLLANPGDEFLCPSPAYPLFEYIAKLAEAKISPYPLKRCDQNPYWSLDLEELENRITTKTKGVVLISPHNPTGFVLNQNMLREIATIASRHHLPILHDEVFSEFIFNGEKFHRAAATQAPLVFTLNGFSKMFALPGVKLGWIGISGEDQSVKQACEGLEMISDTFLPVSEVVQFAAPKIFTAGRKFLPFYQEWVKQRMEQVICALSDQQTLRFLKPQGGFQGLVQLTDALDEEQMSLALLQKHGLLTHPGSFYDLRGNHLVFSFLHDEENLQRGLQILIRS